MGYKYKQFAICRSFVFCGLLAPGMSLAASDADSRVIEEVIVTAQKRAESSQTVPVSISTLSGEQIADQKIININQITAQIPNMEVVSPWGDAIPIFSLRGISTVDYSHNQSSPVALYVDEVYKGVPVFTSLQVFDVQRLEVLRGPQGTLYGKNTTGGAVNFHTNTAEFTDEVTGYVNGGVGNYDRREVSGAVNLPLIDDVLATRVAVSITEIDGYIDNKFPGASDQNAVDNWAVRWSTRWQPTDTLEATFRVTRTEANPTGYGILADDVGPGGVGFFTDYYREGLSYFESETDTPGELDISNTSAALTITWNVTDDISLTSVTAFDEGEWITDEDSDGTPISILQANYVTEADAWSQDLRLASNGPGRLQWMIGIYAYSDKIENDGALRYFYSFAALDGDLPYCFIDFFTGCAYTNELRQERESFAIYTQESYQVTDALSITFGLRYTDDKNELDYYRGGFGFLDPVSSEEFLNVAPTITAPPVDSADDSYVDGRLGIEYQWDRTMLYASLSRGHRGTAFNGAAFGSPDEINVADPEEVRAIEMGLKTMLLDDSVRLNGAVFHYRYEDQHFINFTPEGLQVLYNAPKSTIWGMELELTARPTDTVDFHMGVSYLDTEFDEIFLEGQDLSGNELIAAPELTFNARLDWLAFSNDAGLATLSLSTRYTSDMYFDAFNSSEGKQSSYWIHDARVKFEFHQWPVTVSAWVKNISDEEYSPYRINTLSFFNYNYAQRNRPREYGIDFSYTF